jgi:hypothetical protein
MTTGPNEPAVNLSDFHLMYVLVDRKPVECHDMMEWAEWFRAAEADGSRRVALTEVGHTRISTVFLGTGRRGFLFETMCFGGSPNNLCERCGTWEQAEAQHEKVVAEARQVAAPRQGRHIQAPTS